MQVAVENDSDFIEYEAKFLEDIKHLYISNKETKLLYRFIASRFYRLFKYAEKEHNKFFWLLCDPVADFDHYSEQAKAWSIPIYKGESPEKVHKRVIKGFHFLIFRGVEKQVEEVLNISISPENWRPSDYNNKKRISIDIIGYTDEKAKFIMEYLEKAIPPYIEIDLKDYKFTKFGKRRKYSDIIKEGGSSFALREINTNTDGVKFKDVLMLPDDAFRIGKSKFGKDVVKRIVDKTTNKDKKTIIMFVEKNQSKDKINGVIDSFLLKKRVGNKDVFEEDTDVFVLDSEKEDLGN